MQLAHLDSVCEIEKTINSKNYWVRSAFVSELNNINSICIVAEQKNFEVLGYACMNIVCDEGHIINLAVEANHRKKGIGTALMQYILNKSVYWELKNIFLEVRENNINAQSLYTALGFEKIGIRPNYYLDNRENALIFQKSLF